MRLATSLIHEYERGQNGNPQNVQTAIQHLQAALNDLEEGSPLRPLVFSELCYAHTSEYIQSGSQRAIDDAVQNGRWAHIAALLLGLPQIDSDAVFDSYCRLMNNFGFALSTRAQERLRQAAGNTHNNQAATALQDLDEAIELAREHKSMLEARGEPSDAITFNLAAHLSTRGSKMGTHATDHVEAIGLLRQLQQTAPAGSESHSSAALQIGQLEVEAFKRTKSLEALDAGLRAMEGAVEGIPASAEMFALSHNAVKSAYLDRHKHTGDIDDLAKALKFSARTLDANPCAQHLKVRYLVAHLTLLHRFALATTSLSRLDQLERQASKHLESMPRPFLDEPKCRRLHSDVVIKKYLLSKKLEDLRNATFTIYEMLHDDSGHTALNGQRIRMNLVGYYRLMKLVDRLLRLPRSRARTATAEAIYTCISGLCKPPSLIVGLVEVSPDVVGVLEMYERSARTGEVISEEVAKQRAAEAHQEEGSSSQRQIHDFNGPLTNIFGFDPTLPMHKQRLATRLSTAERIIVQRAKAEGKHPNPRLCLTCQALKPLRPVSKTTSYGGGDFEWNPDMIYLPLGTWDQLRTRRDCSICRLVRSLIVTDPESDAPVLHPRLQIADDPEIEGAGVYVAEEQETGERVLIVHYNQKLVGHLRILPGKQPVSITTYLQAQLTPENYRQHGSESGNQKASPELLRRWLENCSSTHGETCSHRSTSPRYLNDKALPIVLVDVVDRCLVTRTSSTTKYFVLSYVRGAVSVPATRQDNYASRCRPGGLPAELPATIQDAMAFVQSLGDRYLWVDTLCSIQDIDRYLKAKLCASMDVILIHAYATIVALSSNKVSGGILGVDIPWSRQARREILTIDVGSSELYYTPIPKSAGRDGPEKVTVELIATPTPLDLVVATSVWDQRAWTVQERFLSPRCLYFTDQTVYFRCGSPHVFSQGGVNGPVRPISECLAAMNQEPMDAKLIKSLRDSKTNGMTEEKKLFDVYKEAVTMYTNRTLSQEGDILDAFAGALSLFCTAFRSQHWCGLPTSVLAHALLWTPAEKTYRRGLEYSAPFNAQSISTRPPGSIVPTNRGTVQLVYAPSEVTVVDDNVDRRFPSWSWAGWKGAVDYRLFQDDHKGRLPVLLVGQFGINLGARTDLCFTPDRGESDPAQSRRHLPLPSVPNVLQFLAPCVPLTNFNISHEVEYISPAKQGGKSQASTSKGVRPILDRQGKRCGLWWEQAGYVYVGRGLSSGAEAKMILVGVSSQSGDATRSALEPLYPEEEPITMFDAEVYAESGHESGVVNVVAVDLDMGHEYGERITVARIHQKAWQVAQPTMRMVRLA
ncbi:HET-domain-containing protein [Rhypophila decipiens]|uniref:HET-domain-containing protein n=1 Tax=Rhypophila decipiens TaxID=261697 RepID=A0AAN6XXH7_9PEZI|nr:HET-domain-containing protein [Rhypophila decipiens]